MEPSMVAVKIQPDSTPQGLQLLDAQSFLVVQKAELSGVGLGGCMLCDM